MRVRTVVAAEILLLAGLAALVAAAWLVERGFGLDAPLALGRTQAAAVAAAPAILWLGYVYSQDRHEAAPKHYLVGTFLMGAFLAGPVAEWLIGGALAPHPAAAPSLDPLAPERLVRAFLIVAAAQELAKYVVVRYSVYRTSELDQPLDAMVYMTAAGLGYASFLSYDELGAGGGHVFLSTAVARAVVTALAHACFAVVLGYALGVAKFKRASPLTRALGLAGGLAAAIALNGQYLVVSGALSARGLAATPWRALAYGFGFAAVVFIGASVLMRRLVALAPERAGGAP